MTTGERKLGDLRGIGKKMLEDFDLLGIRSVRQLRAQDAVRLYNRMCALSGVRQDPSVIPQPALCAKGKP